MKRRDNRRESDSFSATERPTMITCEQCGGAGQVEREIMGVGTYSVKGCIWCNGSGTFSKRRQKAYRRWKRMRLHYISKGLIKE
jgi:DnaJ-class molecular chaperone